MHRVLSMTLACVLALGASVASNATVRNVPQTYKTIQAAVDAAHHGDTIRINGGTYNESVIVGADPLGDQYNLEFDGENGATMVGAMIPSQPAINIFSVGNSVHGLTIRNYETGISIGASGRIYSNTISNCVFGVYAQVFGDVVNLPAPTSLDHNLVCSNNFGIFVSNSQNVTVSQNTALNNGLGVGGAGIWVEFSDHCTVTSNLVTGNAEGILAFLGASACTFTYNISIGNQSFDAEDDNGPGQNIWAHNIFGTTSGI